MHFMHSGIKSNWVEHWCQWDNSTRLWTFASETNKWNEKKWNDL